MKFHKITFYYFISYLHPNKIIGVCLQIFDSVIRDWLESPRSFESPPAKASDGEAASGKERNGVLVLGDAT
jgi:hypothetical protein